MEEQIIQILSAAIPNLEGIYLFGSYASGAATAGSDVDLAFLSDHPSVDPLRRWKLQEQLAGFLNKDVDLIDLQTATTVLRFEIITAGRRIFCPDEYFCDSFEMVAYSMYQHLQEERKEILEDIFKRGSVYG